MNFIFLLLVPLSFKLGRPLTFSQHLKKYVFLQKKIKTIQITYYFAFSFCYNRLYTILI